MEPHTSRVIVSKQVIKRLYRLILTQQKGTRGMPWLLQAKKDVASDETLRGPAGMG